MGATEETKRDDKAVVTRVNVTTTIPTKGISTAIKPMKSSFRPVSIPILCLLVWVVDFLAVSETSFMRRVRQVQSEHSHWGLHQQLVLMGGLSSENGTEMGGLSSENDTETLKMATPEIFTGKSLNASYLPSKNNATTISKVLVKNSLAQAQNTSVVESTQRARPIQRSPQSLMQQPSEIKITLPVFVASLSKSGTTSVHRFFKCGNQRSVHYSVKGNQTGACIYNNIQKGRAPLDLEACGMPPKDVFTDNNYLRPENCYYPSVYALDAVYEAYPNATLLLAVRRDSHMWLDSVRRWGNLLWRFRHCPDLWPTQQEDIGNRTLTRDEVRQFYLWHQRHVRNFAQAHPSMTYIEVTVEDNNTGAILEERTGIPATCWGDSNQNTRRPREEATTQVDR